MKKIETLALDAMKTGRVEKKIWQKKKVSKVIIDLILYEVCKLNNI